MSVKITAFEAENVKRIKAVTLAPAASGLTIIGGRNAQGKTSVLDAIAWALGGDKFRPGNAARDGSVLPPKLRVELSNGLIVERRGKNSELTVTDPSGRRAGQTLLNSFVEVLALNLPRFLNASSREKAQTLLQIIGVGDQLAELEMREKSLYQERLAVGRIADQKQKHAQEMDAFPELPEDPLDAGELIRQQQEILARNGQNQQFRRDAADIAARYSREAADIDALSERMVQLQRQLDELVQIHAATEEAMLAARKTADELQDESTAELKENLRQIEDTNAKIRKNREKAAAEADAAALREQYDDLTGQIEDTRREKLDLLNGADMPLPGLSVENGELTYHGQPWDCMSAAEQLRAGAAIVRRLNPECGFVLMDRLEQMDLDTLRDFGAWLEAEGLQAIATRVSTGDECQIVIEDGYARGEPEPQPAAKTWKAGEF